MRTKLELIVEGRTELYVPAESLRRKAPETHPVFFNPAGRVNRDISVALAAATHPRTVLDVLAGVGARGVRMANECRPGLNVTMVDFNEPAISLAKRNVRKNHAEPVCEVVHSEANAYLFSRFGRDEKFDAVDVDPFGSPAMFVQGAISATADGGIMSLTATDTAVLCGVYPKVSVRRYGASSVRNDFVHETGIRILAGFCARLAGMADAGVRPVAAHSTLHYVRLYLKVARGAAQADRSLGNVGYVHQCNVCHLRSATPDPVRRCEGCGAKARSSGPLWTGELVDGDAVTAASRFCIAAGWADSSSTLTSISGLNSFPPYGYSLERVCSREKVSSVRMNAVIGELRSNGHTAMRDPFEDCGIKTDAPYETVAESVRRLSSMAEAD